jgi:alpha-beta hydrolase superfamily lysophospholipase
VEFNWKTIDGVNIFAKDWKIDQPKAVIALVHGFGEHCMRYDSMAKYYNDRNYAMVGYDRRGHGRSGGAIGYTPSYAALLDEIDQLLHRCSERYPNVPIIIYGHSMGGNLVLNYMIERSYPDIKLTVATGPWIRLVKEPASVLKSVMKFARKFAPKVTVGQKIGAFISRVQEEVVKYNNDPLVHGKMSFALGDEMFKSCKRLESFSGAFPTPLLLEHAGDDKITDPEATKAFAKRVTSAIQLKIWKNLYHEIHNESIREQVYDYTIDWLDENI